MAGWIKLHRKILDNPVVMKSPEHFMVWAYLLLEATHEDYPTLWGKDKVVLKPGQVIKGRLQIARDLKINESKVKRILNDLKNDQQIDQQAERYGSLITILNWHVYQNSDQQIDQQVTNKRPTSDQQVTSKQEHKNIRTKENNNRRFAPPSVDDVRAYCQERKNKVDPEAFVDFYTSKNWMVGKNKMKDWKAAVRNWERMEAGRSRQDTSKSSSEPPRYKDYKPEARNAVPMSAEQKANREKILQGVSEFIKEA